MTALSHAIYTGTENAAFVDDDVRAVTLRAHKSITAAIRSRDSEAAARRMRRHVHSYAKAALAMDERDAVSVDD
jgi:DNA-binding FadR family transcriptional regulator